MLDKIGVFLHINLAHNFQNCKKCILGAFWPENFRRSHFCQVSDTCICYKMVQKITGLKNEASISSIRPPVLTSPTLVTLAQKMRSELRISSHQLLSPLPLYEKISELPRQFKIAKTFQKKLKYLKIGNF